jgi:aspartyl-tRNA(Asn)/glutamyl-tRNA(Gln) amidotransferase subunit A
MNNNELIWISLAEAADLLRREEISPVELTAAYLERIQTLDKKLNSFITVTAETAMSHASLAEQELQRGSSFEGTPLGLLHGIPIALKDLYETQGVRTTAGSRFFADYIPETDAMTVQKLSTAGAILLGKTNMHEIALGLTTVNPHYGACKNPWALERVPGGSSGGSGAALAAGLCLGSLGSDTGGSIRVPAALCGIVGMKPTYGRVSLRGVIPLSWNLDHAGPMARCVQDVAMLLQVIAGYDPDDPYSVDVPVVDYLANIKDGVKDWRVSLMEDEYLDRTDAEILAAVQEAAQVFSRIGARVKPTAFPGAYPAALANGQMVISDAAVFHRQRLHDQPEDFGDDVRQRLQAGAELPLREYILARRTQTMMRWQFENFFHDYDILLMPTTAVVAPPIEGPDAIEQARLLTRFTAPFNRTGLPAISLPCGFTSAGLPIGLQVVAPSWGEANLLRAAYAYEKATPWHERRPIL